MTAAQLAFPVSMLVLEPLPVGEERSRVPYAWSINGFGLNLASFQLMLDAPELKNRATCPCGAYGNAAERRSWPMEGERQGRQLYGRWRCRSGGGRSTLNWNTMSRAQPYPSRKGGKLKQDELYVVCAALPTSMRTVHLFRLSTGQCDASSLSEWNQEETNVTNYTVGLTHFFAFFFHPMMYFVHDGMPLYRGGGVL